jgi:hypothetical protein
MTEVDFREPVSLFDYDQPEIVFAADEPSTEIVAQYQPPSVSDDDAKDPITYAETKGFWRRQFQPEPTDSQRWCDWAFGVVLPILCFVFDPFVFKDWGDGGHAFLQQYQPFAYVLSFASIMSMVVWLKWGDQLQAANAAFAGLFALGGLVSLAVGVMLFPISLIGMIILIGALGFTPLFTSIVYFRNSYRAYLSAGKKVSTSLVCHIFLLTALFSFVIPYLVNVEAGTWVNPILYIERFYGRPTMF